MATVWMLCIRSEGNSGGVVVVWDEFRAYLADNGEMLPADMKSIHAQREDGRQSHHAAHCRHVVQVRLRILNIPAAQNKTSRAVNTFHKHTQWIQSVFIRPQSFGSSLPMRTHPQSSSSSLSYGGIRDAVLYYQLSLHRDRQSWQPADTGHK